MPNLNDMSRFLKREDVKNGDILKFKDAGEIKDVDFSLAKDGSNVKTVFQIGVELPDGKTKIVTLNKTSERILKEDYGVNTDNWVGKQVEVVFERTMCFGKMMDVMILKPAEQARVTLDSTERLPEYAVPKYTVD